MTLEDSLDHFLNCFTRADMLRYWRIMRDNGDSARRCLMADHEGHIYDMQQYITLLREQIANHKD